MRCAAVYIDWSAGIYNGKVKYNISEIAAISLDRELHTMDVFRFILDRPNGYVQSERHFEENKVLITDLQTGWEKFMAWCRSLDYLIVWQKEQKDVMLHFGQIYKKKSCSYKYICLYDLFDKMTLGISKESRKIADAMQFLELKCEKSRVNRPLYCAQAMVRMFRKLYRLGRNEMGDVFNHGLMDGDYFYISQHNYFPKLRKKLLGNRDQQIGEIIENFGYQGRVLKSRVSVDTNTAHWEFNIMDLRPVLYFHTRKFYRGERSCELSLEKMTDWRDRLKAVLYMIKDMEEQFLAGVGNKELTDLVEKLALCTAKKNGRAN